MNPISRREALITTSAIAAGATSFAIGSEPTPGVYQVQKQNKTVFNVKDFPDVRTAVAAMRNANGGVLYFPAGLHVLKEKLDVSNMSCSIIGDGVKISILRWQAPERESDNDNAGIFFRAEGRDLHSLNVSDLTLETERHYGGTAIDADPRGGGKPPSIRICNVTICGRQVGGRTDLMWRYGIVLRNATQVQMNRVSIYGTNPGCTQTQDDNCAIDIGATDKVWGSGYYITDLIICDYRYGIRGRHFAEAIYVTNFEMVTPQIAIDLHAFNVAMFSQGHIDYLKHAAIVTNSHSITFRDIYFKTHDYVKVLAGTIINDDTLRFMYIEHENSNRVGEVRSDRVVKGSYNIVVSGCNFQFDHTNLEGSQTPAYAPGASGIVISQRIPDTEKARIFGNSFAGFPGKAVLLSSGTVRNKIFGNKIDGCREGIKDEGDNDKICND